MEFLSIFGDYRFLSGCGFVTAAACYVVAALILSANRRSPLCQIAFAFKIAVGSWSLFYALMYHAGNGPVGLLVSRCVTATALFIGVFFLQMTAKLTGESKRIRTLIVANYIYAFVCSGFIFFSTLFVKSSVPKLDFPAYSDDGPLYFLLPLQMVFSYVLSTILLVRQLSREEPGAKKDQIKMFLLATVISYPTGMLSYFLVYDIPIKPVTTPFVVIFPLLIAYAIVKHRFLDIRKLVRNTIIFSLLFCCLLIVVAVMLLIFQTVLFERVGVPERVCQFLAILVALVLYTPLKKGLAAVTRKLLFQGEQSASIIFRKLSEDLFRLLDLEKLSNAMTERLALCLSLEQIAFYRFSEADYCFNLKSAVGLKEAPCVMSHQDALIQHLRETRHVLLNPFGLRERMETTHKDKTALTQSESQERAQSAMVQGGWAIALPVFIREKLDGIILIGYKKSDLSWPQEELSVLESFANGFSLALMNADAAAAIRTLQRKILASERDASAGALIAGVDHEAKNPLHAASLALSSLSDALGNAKFIAQDRERQETVVKEALQSVLEDIEEVNHVIRHLSDLAEQKPLRIYDGVFLNSVCRKAIKMSGVSDKVQLKLDFSDLFTLTCDPEALQEVLSNLIRNAAQAGAAEIWIQAHHDGHETMIEVRDSGSGIPSAIAKRIFEPFFTTKDKRSGLEAAGSGMGLFIVRESMRAMGGDIELVQSGQTHGSVFRLSFKVFTQPENEGAYAA